MTEIELSPLGSGRIRNSRFYPTGGKRFQPYPKKNVAAPSPLADSLQTRFELVHLGLESPGPASVDENLASPAMPDMSCEETLPVLPPYQPPELDPNPNDGVEPVLRLADHVFAELWSAIRCLDYQPDEVPLPDAYMQFWLNLLEGCGDFETFRLWQPEALVSRYLTGAAIAVRLCIFAGLVVSQFDGRQLVLPYLRDILMIDQGIISYFGAVMEVIDRLSSLTTGDLLDGVECVSPESPHPTLLSPIGVLVAVEHPMADRALICMLHLRHYLNRMAAVTALGNARHDPPHQRTLEAHVATLHRRFSARSKANALVEFGDVFDSPETWELLHYPDYSIMATRFAAALGVENCWLDSQLVSLYGESQHQQSRLALAQQVLFSRHRVCDLFPDTRSIQKHICAANGSDGIDMLRMRLPLMHYRAPSGSDPSRELELHLLSAFVQITLSTLANRAPLDWDENPDIEFICQLNHALPFRWVPRVQYSVLDGARGPEQRNAVELIAILYLNAGPASPFHMRSIPSGEETCISRQQTAKFVARLIYFSRLCLVFLHAFKFTFAHLSPIGEQLGNNAYFYPRFYDTTRFVSGKPYKDTRTAKAFAFYIRRLAELSDEIYELVRAKPLLPEHLREVLTPPQRPPAPAAAAAAIATEASAPGERAMEPFWPWTSWKHERYASRFGTAPASLPPVNGLHPASPLALAANPERALKPVSP